MRHSAALERRVAKLVADEFNAAPEPVQRAMLAQMSAWHQRQVTDQMRPHDVAAFLRAVAEAAPDIAQRVADKVNIDVRRCAVSTFTFN